MRAVAARVLLTLSLLSLAGLSACDEDEFFRPCPLSQTIIDVCEADSPTTSLTCVVREHPLCDEQVCSMWQDSEPFCTRSCVEDADCPEGSICEPHLDFALCVPLTVLEPAVAP